MREKQIFFHVGLGKTASTYLQQSVFPNLEGVKYISTHQYKKAKSIIPQLKQDKVLVSREFDRQFEEEVRWFTNEYPEARIIIVLRRHDEWIASQYKRHVKNGFFRSFEEFIDLENDTGYWKLEELNYKRKLKIIQECCVHAPLVLIYDELVKDPASFIRKVTDYLGVKPLEKASVNKIHRSFSDKQLKVLRAFTKQYIRVVPRNYPNKILHWLLYRPVWAFYHLILFVARFLPDSWVPAAPLINQESLKKVKVKYNVEWQELKQFS